MRNWTDLGAGCDRSRCLGWCWRPWRFLRPAEHHVDHDCDDGDDGDECREH